MYSEFQQKRESIEQQTYTTKMTKEDFFLQNEEKELDGSTNLYEGIKLTEMVICG